MKARVPLMIAAAALAAFIFYRAAQRPAIHSALPSPQNAKALLNTTPRHREWAAVPVGSATVLAFVVYPERSDKAPVAMVTAGAKGATDFARAVGDQLAAEGYIAVVPDTIVKREIDAVRAYAVALPAANGISTGLDLATRTLTGQTWPRMVALLNRRTHNQPHFGANPNAPEDHSTHIGMMMGQQISTVTAIKKPDLPAGYYTAQSTLANSKLRHEWVDIPLGDVKLHTWIVYPSGDGKAPVVIAMQHGTGLDDWMRAVADQLAQQGFIAVAPDTWSGTGPNGGNRDASPFTDDAMKAAAGKITPEETQRRFKAAREWAMKLPRANGKSASLGFCAGGGNSFRFAGEVPELNAAVVFYGTPPTEEIMARIKAPVLAFYGENDARVTSTAEPTIAAMRRLGKEFESHVYPKATHSFVMFQEAGGNPAAIADAWPRAIAFLNQHTR